MAQRNGSIATSWSAGLATLLAISILIFTGVYFDKDGYYERYYTSSSYVTGTSCKLGTPSVSDDNGDNCIMLYAVGGLTLAVCIGLEILQCVTCFMCGFGGILDFIFAIAGFIAWGVTAGLVTDTIIGSTYDTPDSDTQAYAMCALCWIEFILFFAMLAALQQKCRTVRKHPKNSMRSTGSAPVVVVVNK